MGIGVSILLIAIGAILTFALNVSVGFLDLDVVGWVLMAAGVVGLILTTVIWAPRRRQVVTRDTVDQGPVGPSAPVNPVDPNYRRPAGTTEYRRVEERTDV